jgi:TolB-like protein
MTRHALVLLALGALALPPAVVAADSPSPALPGGETAGTTDGGSGPQRLVVYRLEADETLADLAGQLSDEILLHLGRKEGLTVVGESEVQVMLAHEDDKQALLCEDLPACAARLSTILRADRIITGHVGRIGEMYVVTLKLADAQKAVVEGGESAEADRVEDLPAAVRASVNRLLGFAATDAAPRFALEVAPEGTKVAILDLDAHDVTPGLADNLTQLLSLELKKFEGLGVISRGEIQAMLRFESERQALQCTSDISCLVEIGGALGVDYLVGGSVGRLGDAFVVTLKLMDVAAAEVVSRASQTFRGSETDLAPALRFATWELLGRKVAGAGSIAVEANIDEGQLTVDGGARQTYPQQRVVSDLAAGRHGVSLTADGYAPLYRETYVFEGRETDLRVELVELPTPWYEKWWTWTIIGAVVAAGVTTTVVLLQQDGPSSGKVTVRVQ